MADIIQLIQNEIPTRKLMRYAVRNTAKDNCTCIISYIVLLVKSNWQIVNFLLENRGFYSAYS